MPTKTPLRNRVKELRERLSIRQSELANEVNITRQTIIAIEKGRLNPSILICLKIAKLLREPVDYIFYLEPGFDYEEAAREAAGRPKRGRKKRVPEAATAAVAEMQQPPRQVDRDRLEIEREAAADFEEPDAVLSEAEAEEIELVQAATEPEGPVVVPDVELVADDTPESVEDLADALEPVPADSKEPHTSEDGKHGQAIWDFF